MTTTIYLDVDGVLNAIARFSQPSPKITGWEAWAAKPVNGWPITYSPDMIEALNELAARDDVTFKWLTTWDDDAAKILSPAIGIHGQDWEVLDGDQHGVTGESWWKLEAIRADIDATRPDKFVWIDDDLGKERPALDWLATHPESIGISPEPKHGLTRGALRVVRDFAAERAA